MRRLSAGLFVGCVACFLVPISSVAAQDRKRPALPADRDTTMRQAEEALQAGRRAEAERLLRSAADRFQSVHALLRLASLQADGKDDTGALASLDRARAIAPSSEDVLRAHAEVLLTARRPQAAIHDLEALTRLHPTVAEYHHMFGTALLEIGDASLAAESLREAERLGPGRAATLSALGRALNELKLYAEARPLLQRSLELEPESVATVAALAESQEGLDEVNEAEAQTQRALSRSPDDGTANLVRGLVRMKQGRDEEARAALLKAVAADPASPKPYQALSVVEARLGDEAGARKHLEVFGRLVQQREERVTLMRAETGVAPRGHEGGRP